MKAANYERVVETAVPNATALDHTVSPCEESFIPDVSVRGISIQWASHLCLNSFLIPRARLLCCTWKWRTLGTQSPGFRSPRYHYNWSARFIASEKLTVFEFLQQCFKIWDLDARGSHKGLWRFFLKNNSIMVIGFPFSPYSWVLHLLFFPARPAAEKIFQLRFDLQEIQADSGDPNRITSGIHNSEKLINLREVQCFKTNHVAVKIGDFRAHPKQGYPNRHHYYLSRKRRHIGDIRYFHNNCRVSRNSQQPQKFLTRFILIEHFRIFILYIALLVRPTHMLKIKF